MWRFFIFLVSFVSVMSVGSAKAEKKFPQTNTDDSPWVQLESNGWVLEVDGIGRKETIVLISSPQDLYFTVYRPCLNEYTEVYSWTYGQRYAKGVTCEGKQVKLPTTDWQGWIHPLPPDVREQAVFSGSTRSSVQKKR